MSGELPYSIIGEYFRGTTAALESEPDPRATARLFVRCLGSEYYLDILRSLAEIDGLHRQICIILGDFEPRNFVFWKAMTVDQLILSVKFYVISWATLYDMIAALINKVFDLGFADVDVSFERVLRNRHVRNSELPAILEKYQQPLDIRGMKRHRNEVVHRGRTIDEEVVGLYKDHNILRSKRYSLLISSAISEEEYKQESAKQTEMLFRLASSRQTEYLDHYKTTSEMVAEVLNALSHKAVEVYKAKAV